VHCSSLLVIADLNIISLGFFEIRFTTVAFFIFVTVMSIVIHVIVVAIKTSYLLVAIKTYLLTIHLEKGSPQVISISNIISYLATFLGTNSLSVLMCHKAINQSMA